MSQSKIIAVLAIFGIFCSFPAFSYAYQERDVLGDSTSAVNIELPAVTDGPGFILPDSPLYVLDKVFQKLKLAVAFSPEGKVKTRMLLIGERVAEVRAMMVRENTVGIQVALDELRAESENLTYDLRDAAGQGKDIKDLAKEINDRLALHRDFLTRVTEQTDDSLSLQLTAANQSLLSTKISAEDYLPEEFLAQAITDDLEDEIDRDVLGVETSTLKLERKFEKLEQHASRSAERQQKKQLKEDAKASKSAMLEKRKKMLEERKAKLKKLMEERKAKLLEAREAVKKAREAAKRLREIREEEKKNSEDATGEDGQSGSDGQNATNTP